MQKKFFSRIMLGIALGAGVCAPALAESETVEVMCAPPSCEQNLSQLGAVMWECAPPVCTPPVCETVEVTVCEPESATFMVFTPSFGAVAPIGTLQEDGSYLIDKGAGIQLIGPPLAPTFYGLALDTGLFLFEAEELYGLFVGCYSRIENVYGFQLALANLNGELIQEDFNATGNCYGLQAALGNISGDAYIQIGAIGNFAATVSGAQIGGLANKADTLYGMQIGLVNGVLDSADSCGAQIGLINALDGNSGPSDVVQLGLANGAIWHSRLQAGVINTAEDGMDFQFGLWNESAGAGWQVGLLNFSENAWLPFFPFLLYTAPEDAPPGGICTCQCGCNCKRKCDCKCDRKGECKGECAAP